MGELHCLAPHLIVLVSTNCQTNSVLIDSLCQCQNVCTITKIAKFMSALNWSWHLIQNRCPKLHSTFFFRLAGAELFKWLFTRRLRLPRNPKKKYRHYYHQLQPAIPPQSLIEKHTLQAEKLLPLMLSLAPCPS
jgi:hypothetical protein